MPRPNDRDDDYRDDDDDDRPRRRRSRSHDDDDDYDDRPRRRRRRPSSSDDNEGWLDSQFANTNIAVLVLFGLCCGWIALVFSIVGVAACKNPTAKKNALVVMIVAIINIGLSVLFVIASGMGKQGFR